MTTLVTSTKIKVNIDVIGKRFTNSCTEDFNNPKKDSNLRHLISKALVNVSVEFRQTYFLLSGF